MSSSDPNITQISPGDNAEILTKHVVTDTPMTQYRAQYRDGPGNTKTETDIYDGTESSQYESAVRVAAALAVAGG
jgi:hypothetical protein